MNEKQRIEVDWIPASEELPHSPEVVYAVFDSPLRLDVSRAFYADGKWFDESHHPLPWAALAWAYMPMYPALPEFIKQKTI